MGMHEDVVALGREPISEASPVGDPVRYDEAFEQLQAQLDRLGSLSGDAVQWPVVVDLSTQILKSKSKDLLVMTYLVLGLFEKHGYAGLAAGLEAYTEFIKKFWENCFPKVKPPHGRLNAVQYLADKILPLVEIKGGQAKREPQASEKEAVHQCAAQMEEFMKAVTTAFTGMPDSPNLAPLNRALRALKEKVGPLVTAAPTAGPAEGAAATGAAPAAAPSAGGAAIPETFATPSAAAQAVVRIAKYLLTQDNKDARGYRLMRAAHFGGLTEAPKDRLIPPVPAQRKQFFEGLASSGNWPDLVKEAEGQFAVTPLWLDMQRYVATGLKGMGPAYSAAHHAVAFETLALRARMPELFDLCFKDGSPFADGGTKAWLDNVSSEFGVGGGAGGGSAGTSNGDPLSAAIAEARKFLADSKPADAVARLARELEGSGSRRQRFRVQLALAQFCIDMNKLALASSLLEGLEKVVDDYRLEEWEPDLAATALINLYDCYKRAKPKPTPDEIVRGGNIFARVCRLAPADALRLDGDKK